MEENIKEKLRSEEYMVRRKEGQAAKSEVWDKFCEIVTKDNISIGYVKCNSCDKIYKHDSHSGGTSTLKRHACVAATRESAQTTITGF